MLCYLANLLGNRFVGRYHLPLVGLAGIRLALLGGLIKLCWESLLDLLNVIEQVTNALGCGFSLWLILGLPCPWAHTKNMARKRGIVNGPYLLHGFGHLVALVRAGQ